VATKKYTLDFGSKVTYRLIQDGGSRHYEKIQTNNSVNFRPIPMKFDEQFRVFQPQSKMQHRK
jgi:hypothetical protein